MNASLADGAPIDVLIVGAGVSGIGAACHLSCELPQKSYTILEARDKLGGTWDLFRYPGVRSNSDIPTYAYAFKPWKSRKTFAGADEILAYLREAAAEHGVDRKIRYRCKAMAADWDSASALWRVTVRSADVGSETTVRCRWLFVATGYYDYERGHRPHFPDEEAFRGPILHPQAWPEGFDAKGKRIAVIGSGATAVTLVPALAEAGAQMTQIQRTPSYILPFPSEDSIANALRRALPETTAYAIARRKNILLHQWLYAFFQRYPKAARRFLRWTNRRLLPKGYPVDVHFNPPYDPWDQRLCIAPDGDFLKAIRSGRLSIVTGGIERFTPGGVRMNSGEEIAADVIVAATGLVVTLLRACAFRSTAFRSTCRSGWCSKERCSTACPTSASSSATSTRPGPCGPISSHASSAACSRRSRRAARRSAWSSALRAGPAIARCSISVPATWSARSAIFPARAWDSPG